MRIILFGQAAFGEKVLARLLERQESVIAVYTPADPADKPNPLRELADKNGIPARSVRGKWTSQDIADYKALKPDLNVLAFVTDILPTEILSYPTHHSIQYHPSLLPHHRGGSAINWAVINGETRTGVTIFQPDKGIDTGPILLQKEVEIAPDDTVGSLYFNKLFPIGIDALMESIDLVKQGKAPRIPQDESQATYEGLCTEDKTVINWSQPAQKVYNLIRGSNPQPGAVTAFQGKKLKLFDTELLPARPGGTSGTVAEVTPAGIVISLPDGALLVKRVQPHGSPKVSAVEFARQAGVKAGDMFGS